MTFMRRALIAVAVLLVPAVGRAQMDSREGIALQNQIYELRRDLATLRAQGGSSSNYAPPILQGGGGSAGGSDLTPQLLDRVSQLEDQVRQLRGRLDELDNARQRDTADLGKRIDDLAFKVGAGGSSPAPTPAPTLSPPPGPLGASTVPVPSGAPVRRTPEVALAAGTAALGQRDYDGAAAAAREVLAGGKGPRTTDAQFLLAEALAGKRDYAAAAVAYDDAYRRNARGSRAPDSLLGLANALNGIGEKKSACQTLDKLRAEFPSPRADLRDQIAAARTRAGCR